MPASAVSLAVLIISAQTVNFLEISKGQSLHIFVYLLRFAEIGCCHEASP